MFLEGLKRINNLPLELLTFKEKEQGNVVLIQKSKVK